MTDDSPPPLDATSHGRAPAEAAAAWLAALDVGTADLAAFERWRAADPRHAVAFAKAAAVWSDLSTARVSATARPARPDRRWVMKAAGVGGVAVIAAGLGATRTFARTRLTTGVGERRDATLPGHARLSLNTDTSVSWRASGQQLSIWLERGEIALQLAAVASPCIVQTPSAAAAALSPGGQYNARLRGGLLDLTVISGQAAARSSPGTSPGPARATAAQSLLLAPTGPVTRSVSVQEMQSAAAWRAGEIVFENEPLAAAVDEYNRYLTRKLIIADPQVARIRVGGRFTSSDPADFLKALDASLGVRATPAEDSLLLTLAK